MSPLNWTKSSDDGEREAWAAGSAKVRALVRTARHPTGRRPRPARQTLSSAHRAEDGWRRVLDMGETAALTTELGYFGWFR